MSMAAALPPGFRFHPTDEELILHYLRNRAASAPCPVHIIADVDIYKFDPWDLPCQAVYGEQEWYFFSPRDRKYPNGIRPNRAAGSGYWKATGTDKPIHDGATVVGVKKALVFYKGRPPKGSKTSWIMHEYRLSAADPLISSSSSTGAGVVNAYKPIKFRNVSMRLDDWVLCRIYKKSGLQASPMVPPLADYDHMDHGSNNNDDDGLSFSGSGGGGGGFVVDADAACSSFLYAPPSRTTMTPRLPAIPSMSELFDDYALAQLFDAATAAPDEHLAVHPSLNQLLSVGDGHDAYAEYSSSPSLAITGGSTEKRKAAWPGRSTRRRKWAAGGQEVRERLSSCFDDVAPQSNRGRERVAKAAALGASLNHQMLPQF